MIDPVTRIADGKSISLGRTVVPGDIRSLETDTTRYTNPKGRNACLLSSPLMRFHACQQATSDRRYLALILILHGRSLRYLLSSDHAWLLSFDIFDLCIILSARLNNIYFDTYPIRTQLHFLSSSLLSISLDFLGLSFGHYPHSVRLVCFGLVG